MVPLVIKGFIILFTITSLNKPKTLLNQPKKVLAELVHIKN